MSDKVDDDYGRQILTILDHYHRNGDFRVGTLSGESKRFVDDHWGIREAFFHKVSTEDSDEDYLKPDAYLAYLGYLNQLDSLVNARQATRCAMSANKAAWWAVFVAAVSTIVGAIGLWMAVLRG